MLNFTAKSFRACIEVCLWMNLIFCPIYGYIVGKPLGHQILFAIIGLAGGFISNILFGGFIAVILKIDENLETLKDKSFGIETSKTNVSSGDPLNLL